MEHDEKLQSCSRKDEDAVSAQASVSVEHDENLQSDSGKDEDEDDSSSPLAGWSEYALFAASCHGRTAKMIMMRWIILF